MMRLRRLIIRALPGIEPGFSFEPASGGINIVTGPNAIGKSSLARALRYLLAGVDGRNDPPDLHLEAEFTTGTTEWTVRRMGRQVVWRRGGKSADAPALPGADQFGLYRLSMESLLTDDADDRALADRLWRMVRGGYDLDAAKAGGVGPRFAASEERQLREARKELAGLRNEHRDLRLREAELPDLARRIRRAERARVRRGRVETALELLKAIRERRTRGAALRAFPVEMARLHGDEMERLEEFEEEIALRKTELADARRFLKARERERGNTGFGDALPNPELVDCARKALQRVERDAIERGTARVALAGAEETLAKVRAELGGGGTPPGSGAEGPGRANVAGAGGNPGRIPPRLDFDSLDRARRIAQPLVDQRARRRELRQWLDMAGDAPQQAEVDRLRDGVNALRRWLAISEDSPSRLLVWVRHATQIALWAGMTLAALMALWALRAESYWLLGFFVTVMANLFAVFWFSRQAASLGADTRDEAKRSYAETGLETPPEWNREAVREHLRSDVEARLNRLLLRQERAVRAGGLRAELEQAETEIGELEVERKALASELGIDPELPGAPFLRFVSVMEKWDSAQGDHAVKAAALRALDDRIGEGAARVRELLAPWRTTGDPPLAFSTAQAHVPVEIDAVADATVDDEAADAVADDLAAVEVDSDVTAHVDADSATEAEADALRVAFDALEKRLAKAREADGKIESARDSIESLQDRIRNAEAGRSGLFERAGIATAARAELARRVDGLNDWRKANDALVLATGDENRLRGLISDDASLIEAAEKGADPIEVAEDGADPVEVAEEGAVTELQRELRAASEEADNHDELLKKQQDVETLLREARRSHDLERAAAELDKAGEALRDKRDRALLQVATDLLLNDVEDAFRTEREPELLRRARERFEQVTAHEFTLELADKSGFTARDLTQGVLRTPAELSSGTRMQLLLALRLAWTEYRERGGEALPLFLDEALTTSDESRFAVMARTLSRLSRSAGRQIFYLSARRHEATLWKQTTGTEPAVTDLAAVRFGAARADPDSLRVETPPALPSSDGMAVEKYAALIGVHPVNPRADAGGIHLFHLLRDDLGLLHSLVESWRIGTLGQLESLLASDAARTAISERQTRRRVRQRSQTARTWIDLWRQGRGMPVDRAVLDESGAVSGVFLDDAADLAKELEGDGKALVLALRDRRVKGFFASKTDELENWLADKGYVDDSATIEPDERRRLTLQRVVPPTPADVEDVNRVVDWMESVVVSYSALYNRSS